MFLGQKWMAHRHRHLCWHPHMNSEPVGGTWGRWFTLRWTLNTRLDRKGSGHHHHCQPPRYHGWNTWKLFLFAFIPHLMVAFCDFPLFWLPLFLLGPRIHFCKAWTLGFLSYPFSWHFFGQLLRSAWCVSVGLQRRNPGAEGLSIVWNNFRHFAMKLR